jgi:hypothetical protein
MLREIRAGFFDARTEAYLADLIRTERDFEPRGQEENRGRNTSVHRSSTRGRSLESLDTQFDGMLQGRFEGADPNTRQNVLRRRRRPSSKGSGVARTISTPIRSDRRWRHGKLLLDSEFTHLLVETPAVNAEQFSGFALVALSLTKSTLDKRFLQFGNVRLPAHFKGRLVSPSRSLFSDGEGTCISPLVMIPSRANLERDFLTPPLEAPRVFCERDAPRGVTGGRRDLDVKTHWEKIYATRPPDRVSWYRPHLKTSLALIERAARDCSASVIDVGGGDPHSWMIL